MLKGLNTLFLKGSSSNNQKPEKPSKKTDSKEQLPNGNVPKKKKISLSKILWIVLLILIVVLIFSIIFSPNPKNLTSEQIVAILTMSPGSDLSGVNAYMYLYSDSVYVVLDVKETAQIMSDFLGKTIELSPGLYQFYLPASASTAILDVFVKLSGSGASVYMTMPQVSLFWAIIISWLPWVIFFLLGWFIIKMMIDRQTNQGGFGKSSAKPQMSSIRFNDVAGYEEIKLELQELVDFLKNPQKFSQAGARTPKGVLLAGPPGTGKTLFAKAIAGEAGIPFFSISGSDFVEMFVGVGASRVRSLFKTAKEISPALIFIDELDAVGRARGNNAGGSNDEREQTLNQLLVEMDGFVANSGIIIIAATNRPDVLDPALKRPGRFDREIQLRLPDIKERESILIRHARDKKFSYEVNWSNIASRTPGFSGAELENVLNEAAILSIRQNQSEITIDDIDEAIDRVIGGPSKVNNIMSLQEKKLVAYHEAGHALIGLKLKDAQKVQKITIVPRGDAGGYVLMTPKKEKFVQTKAELLAQITSYMGGRASEEIFFGKDYVTTGAYSDIEEATKIATKMVTVFGMSSLGPIQFEKQSFDPYNPNKTEPSDYKRKLIDDEVSEIMNRAYKEAYELIVNNKEIIETFAEALILKETINQEEIQYIYENGIIPEDFYSFKKNKESKNLYTIEEFEVEEGWIVFAKPEEISKIKHSILLRQIPGSTNSTNDSNNDSSNNQNKQPLKTLDEIEEEKNQKTKKKK